MYVNMYRINALVNPSLVILMGYMNSRVGDVTHLDNIFKAQRIHTCELYMMTSLTNMAGS